MKEHYASCSCADIPFRPSVGLAARLRRRVGFTLTEVVLAVGVLSLAILALVGLFGPTMSAVKDVVDRSDALAIADQLNSELQSDEIYIPLEIQSMANRFNIFSEQMITRPSSAGNVSGFPSASSGYGGVLYAWKQFDPNRDQVGNVDLKLSALPPSNDDLRFVDGSVYIVFMERGLQFAQNASDRYDFGNVNDSAYFPILVSIYDAPMDLIVASNGGSLEQADLVDIVNNQRGKALFQYTTVKLR